MLRKVTIMTAIMLGIFMVALVSQQVIGQGSDKNARGRKLYIQYCASCHGVDAKGAGPVAPALKVAPTDLTTIAKRNGKWDSLAVMSKIHGDSSIIAHGTKDMPVWGEYFQTKSSETVSNLNIYALLKYVEAMQVK